MVSSISFGRLTMLCGTSAYQPIRRQLLQQPGKNFILCLTIPTIGHIRIYFYIKHFPHMNLLHITQFYLQEFLYSCMISLMNFATCLTGHKFLNFHVYTKIARDYSVTCGMIKYEVMLIRKSTKTMRKNTFIYFLFERHSNTLEGGVNHIGVISGF